MIAAITGHRPNRIVNWQFVETQLALAFTDLDVTKVIQGMAAGVDLCAAKIAFNQKIPYIAVKPWATHEQSVNDPSYDSALRHAEDVVVLDQATSYPGPWIYQRRNEWMVDHADIVIAVWDGSNSGTYNTVRYALLKEKPVWRINPKTYRVGKYA